MDASLDREVQSIVCAVLNGKDGRILMKKSDFYLPLD